MMKNNMKEKLLEIVSDLSNYELDGFLYSLTINLEDIIGRYQDVEYDNNSIKDIINNIDSEIDSFNITLSKKSYDSDNYLSYWNRVCLIFYSDDLEKGVNISFYSNYLNNEYLEVSSIYKMMKIYETQKQVSRTLYNVINKEK